MSDAQNQGLLVVISGPSGVGKTTIVHRVQEAFEATFSVSATTRPRGKGEEDGIDYFFVDDDRFQTMLDEGEFLEHAEVFGRHRYGTPRGAVAEVLEDGRIMLLDIDVQGGIQIRRNLPGALMLFVLPPSDEELRRRLEQRGRDDDEAIEVRFSEARREAQLARNCAAYDHFIVNDDLDLAVREAVAVIRRHRSQATAAGRA